MKTYLAYVYQDPDSAFGVAFPDLPGCYGAGDTYDEALANAKLSLREYALAIAEDGGEMPPARTHGELAADATEGIEIHKAAFVAEVPLITVGQKRRVNLSIDDGMLAAIDRASRAAGVNRSVFLTEAARAWIETAMGAVTATPAGRRRRRARAA